MHLEMDAAKRHPALGMPESNKKDNAQAVLWMVPPLPPTRGAGEEPALCSPGRVGKRRALHLELCRGIQDSSA